MEHAAIDGKLSLEIWNNEYVNAYPTLIIPKFHNG
jgi:hypothetical protein